MFKNKFDTVTSVFKAKSSTSAKTLSSGLFVAGNVGIAKAFLKNKYNENPFFKIIINSEIQQSAINFFIEHLKFIGRLKSKINQENVDGNTPLHIGAKHGNNQLMKLFIK